MNDEEELRYEWRNLDLDLEMYRIALRRATKKEDVAMLANEIHRLRRLRKLLTQEEQE